MFDIANAEAAARVLGATHLLRAARTLEEGTPPRLDESALCKGFMFVHLYAIYEYSVNAIVQGALSFIRESELRPLDLHSQALTLVLNSKFDSAAAVGRNKVWEHRLELVRSLSAVEPLVALDNSLFPADGSHYRSRQLETIWKVFGLSGPVVPDNRLLERINELVENRNAIAHGRRTADDVGRRYSLKDLEKRIDDVAQIVSHLILSMQTHCENQGLLRQTNG